MVILALGIACIDGPCGAFLLSQPADSKMVDSDGPEGQYQVSTNVHDASTSVQHDNKLT